MKKLFIAALLVLGFAVPAFAQTPAVVTGQPFAIAFDHTGADTVGYQVFIDNAMVRDVPVSVLVAGVGSVTGLTVAARGPHVLRVRAYNEDQFADSDNLDFTGSKPKPVKPGKPRITTGLIALLRSPVTAVEKLVAVARGKSGKSDMNIRIIQG